MNRICNQPFCRYKQVRVRLNCHHYVVKTDIKVLAQVDLSQRKIQNLFPQNTPTSLPLDRDWEQSTAIHIHYDAESMTGETDTKTFFYVGGLLALMQAAQKLSESPSDVEVVYVRNQETPKTLLSGHQGHIHPTEWPTTECGYWNLGKAMLQAMNFVKQNDAAKVDEYSYLHFSLKFKELIGSPLLHAKIFGSCFIQRIKHSLTSNSLGISKQDQWLCDSVAKSLKVHLQLSNAIEAETGKSTFTQKFRIYWSPNKDKMLTKEKVWRALNIPVEPMNMEEKMRYTLLKKDSPLYILKILSDGKFYPDTPERIAEHLTRKYPNFKSLEADITDIHLTPQGAAKSIEMTILDSKKKVSHQMDYFFGSTGHDKVMKESPLLGSWKPLWTEIPVSGVSTVWKCTLERQELEERWNAFSLTDEEIANRMKEIVPAANLSNLHVTSWDCAIEGTQVVMMIRVSEGAHFNSHIAFKNDLLNMSHNLDSYFIGDWELMSVGSCTRKTWATNVPELVEVSDSVQFMHGQSGIGYSFSGAPKDSLRHP